jgi:hypothetical protein
MRTRILTLFDMLNQEMPQRQRSDILQLSRNGRASERRSLVRVSTEVSNRVR